MDDGQHASDDSGGYVHDPEAFREGGESRDAGPDTASSGRSVPRNDPRPSEGRLTVPERESFGLRGWVLVGILLLAFLVVPTIILFVPPAALPFEVAFLILPLLPAILLGAVAVWSALGGAV
ncbi:hypothetical protein BRC86_02495 [Halobacteriales archaeon QS_3_64_16]|nr:MAG: hypothetical protein BRC86_02495 [Halobacteriales archaeon QS_3_64_16]